MNSPNTESSDDRILERQLREMNEALLISSIRQHELTEQAEKAAAALEESEARYRSVVDNLKEVVFQTDAKGRWTFLNPAWMEITGFPVEESLGTVFLEYVHPEDRDRKWALFQLPSERSQDSCRHELRYLTRDGGFRWVEVYLRLILTAAGEVIGMSGTLTDITDRKATEARIERLAYHDTLTGLPNRALFMDRLEHALAQAGRHGWQLALLFVDLDRFKTINDTLGHAAGDALLQQVGSRIERLLRAEDTVARLGGDEFVILLSGLSATHDAAHVASKAAAALAAPFEVDGHELHATASIGISLFPRDGADSTTLLKYADAALYQAKERGRNIYVFFNPAMTRQARARLALENGLRRALERGELCLYYQPQAALRDGVITGVETLMRWQHPEQGLIASADFMTIAEETGLIVPIGQWVLRSACTQVRTWQRAGLPRFRVGVNLSPRQFGREDLVATVRKVLAETHLEPECLELELTESSMAHDPERAIDTLYELRALGVQLTLDDFGTGYSSLGYLKRFPLHRLKIDCSFVQDIPTDPDAVAIVQAILALARQLKLGVVAEGVETEA